MASNETKPELLPRQRIRKMLHCSLGIIFFSTISWIMIDMPSLDVMIFLRPPSSHHRLLRRHLLEEQQPMLQKVKDNAQFLQETRNRHLPMFEPPIELRVMGPSVFPKPSRLAKPLAPKDTEIVPYLHPSYGTHRHDEDAVFIFAAEYSVQTYALFLRSLRESGYQGDVVMAISKLDWQDPKVKEFLTGDPHVVVYVMNLTCYNAEQVEVDSSKGGIRVCKCHHLYAAQSNSDETNLIPLDDPREPRTVPTTRYEIYWIWVQHYAKHSWMLVIDARDTVFQANPFDFVPRETDKDRPDGAMILFGENMEATRIGKSKKNSKWLTNAYGSKVADLLKDKPTICSGSTMSEQVALETYLRAMVAESDETGVKLMGADQGFHNYLYYSTKLGQAKTIHSIIVQDQGMGIINNLGALRTEELEKWGNGNIISELPGSSGGYKVLNWDGTPSPVVHQFDRHKRLSKYWYKQKAGQYLSDWRKAQPKV